MHHRAALVTGASTGIGKAIATVLAEEGYSVTIVARHERHLAAAAAELRTVQDRIYPLNADVAREPDLHRIVAAHQHRWGRLDVLVNNAGIAPEHFLDLLATDEIDHEFAVNLRAPLVLTRECLPLLMAAAEDTGRSLVVNAASIVAHTGGAGIASYSATKAGLLAATHSMNLELADRGIRALALSPALVDTPITEHLHDTIPAADMILPSDVAEGVRFVLRLSDRCVVPEIVFQRVGNGTRP